MKCAEEGYVLQVGDWIEKVSCGMVMGYLRISRVTAKTAYVRYNEKVEAKAPRVYSGSMRWRLGAYTRAMSYYPIKAADFEAAMAEREKAKSAKEPQ